MPTLLTRIGLGEFAKSSVRSPFREDKNPSWGIFQREGKWFFKDQATGDSGDEITLLARWKGLDERRDFRELLKLYSDLAGLPLKDGAPPLLRSKAVSMTQKYLIGLQKLLLSESGISQNSRPGGATHSTSVCGSKPKI